MKNEIIKFISKFIELSEDEANTVLELDLIRKYKKGTVLLKKGAVSKECFLILSGCVRSYYLMDGEEKATGFYVESQLIYTTSYLKATPSEYYLSCLEDCILCVGTTEKTNELITRVPKLKTIGHIVNTELLADTQASFDQYMTLNPEKRYLKLLETRPDICNRIPQYHLASYLGIKPESLSRIRRRLTGNKTG